MLPETFDSDGLLDGTPEADRYERDAKDTFRPPLLRVLLRPLLAAWHCVGRGWMALWRGGQYTRALGLPVYCGRLVAVTADPLAFRGWRSLGGDV